jgi:D-alanine--D-alanine ligase
MENTKLKVVVLFGGTSPEYEVSCNSAASILRNIDQEKYEIYALGITRQGKWMLTHASPDEIADTSWENHSGNKDASICPDRRVHGIRLRDKDIRVDTVFNIIHGQFGEDGTMQGLLDVAGIPYVGAGTLASAACMDKEVTRAIVREKIGTIKMAKYYSTDRVTFSHSPEDELKNIEEYFGGEYPLFVKPASDGSSVGISKVKNQMELFEGIKLAATEDFKILIEETIVGREIEVAVLGNRTPHASPVGEILSANEFYDYEAKYSNPLSKTRIVDDLPEEKIREIQNDAVEIFKAMGCEGLSRADFFLSTEDEVVFNEINTLPGFTSISLYPKLWGAAGIEYGELIDKLIELSMEED